MLYEVRTYRLKQGTTNKAIDAFAEGYEQRKKHSELAAFWYTEIGPLNEIIHVWPYESMDIAARSVKRLRRTRSGRQRAVRARWSRRTTRFCMRRRFRPSSKNGQLPCLRVMTRRRASSSIRTTVTPVIIKIGAVKLPVVSARMPMLIGPSAPPTSAAEK